MTDKIKYISAAILSFVVFTILAATPAHADEWGWGRGPFCHRDYGRYHRDYGHHRHDGYPSYGKIVINLPGKYVSFIFGGKRYYECHDEYYRRNGRHFERVSSPYGASVVYRFDDDHGRDRDYRDDHNDWYDRE